MRENKDVKRYLDEEGKIMVWPSRKSQKLLILEYLSEKFQTGIDYNEKQVNEIIDQYHTFCDYFLLRRELIENAFLMRTRDCSRYWKSEKELHD